MPNQIIFGATITPTSAPMEVTINGGASFTPGTFTPAGSNQQYTLSAVPAATYAPGSVGLRAQGYPATVLYNTAQIIVTGTAPAQTITANSATPS